MSSPRPIRIPASSAESVPVDIQADSDPTGETLQFFFTTGSDTNQPTNAEYETGSWVAGSYSSRSGWAQAKTHTVGASGASPAPTQSVVAGVYRLWGRVTTAQEAPVMDLGLYEFY